MSGNYSTKARTLALTGLMCALGVLIMMLGGLVPMATYCCPALAGLVLLPVFVECGEKIGYAAYIAIALLSLIVGPDKESALLFAFIGYYPVLRWRLDRIRPAPLRIGAKLGIFNLAIIIMYLLCLFVFRLDQVLKDYQEMGIVLSIVCLLVGNLVLLLYDRLLPIAANLYVKRFRGKIK